MLILSLHNRHGHCLFREAFTQFPLRLGRSSQCEARVRHWGIQKEHLLIDLVDGCTVITPMAGNCALNGKAISQSTKVTISDQLSVASYRLHLVPGSSGCEGEKQASFTEENRPDPKPETDLSPVNSPQPVNSAFSSEGIGSRTEYAEELLDWRRRLHREVVKTIDLKRLDLDQYDQKQLRQKMHEWITDILAQSEGLPKHLPRESLIEQVIDEAIGLGPLESLLRQDSVSEVMVNRFDEVFFEEDGQLQKSDVTFTSNQAVLAAIDRIVAPIGRRIDESSPMVDARLPDGSRVNAVIPPLALKGPSLTIRKFAKGKLSAEQLVHRNSLNEAMVQFLQSVVRHKQNVLISGGTGSGKTTLLNVLSTFIPAHERIVTIEDAAELQLAQPNLVSLEARPGNQEGQGLITIRDLVRNCLRMRPDRIIVGECRGGEALDMLQAMNTGHDGSLTTAHANSPRDALVRLEVMVMMAGMDLPLIAIREQISSALQFIVQQSRFPCGQRKVTSISEVSGIDNGTIQLSEIFRFRVEGYDSKGRVQGNFESTGVLPDFYEKLTHRGITVDRSLFRSAT